jgi:hypothetical protein
MNGHNMKLLPVYELSDNDHSRAIHVNINQIQFLFKRGSDHFLVIANEQKRIAKSSFNMLMNFSYEDSILKENV